MRELDPSNLVDQRSFTFVLNHEVHKAIRLQYCFSLLCLTPNLPPGEDNPALTKRLAELAIGRVRATDLASTLPPASVALLLIDAEAANLPGIFQRLKVELEPVTGVTLSAGGASYPRTATRGDELLRRSVELMTRARAEGGNRLYLPP